jgi:hypothetical protein
MARVAAALAAAALGGCPRDVVCPEGQLACDGICRAVQDDPAHCGACGRACAAGEACQGGACTDCASACTSARGCQAGACVPDVWVACFATDELYGRAGDLSPAGPPRAVDDGPISLAALGGRVWASHALSPTVVGLAFDDPAPARFTLGGGDLEVVRARDGLLYVSDASVSTLAIVDPAAGVAGEISLARAAGVAENPHGIAFASGKAYVALYGSSSQPSFGAGQAIAVVDLSTGAVTRLSLEGVAGAYDDPGFPFPSGAAAVGDRVFVTLPNLKARVTPGGTFYIDPAGDGRLAVVDAAGDTLLPPVDLGAGCTNPGGIVADGGTVWVACGSGAVVPVDAATLAVGTPVPMPDFVVPGGLAVCGGQVYAADQYSGQVVRFAASGPAAPAATEVCPLSSGPFPFALAADVTCAP